ncbi:MAG TPA: TspO/MBR family protein [Candidatus Saccharimonadales bacterium]|nr:TspO/MBR family protein [Candidatus Saccharimonadales bacterium]
MSIVKLVVSLVVPFAAATVGTIATIPNIPTWYAALEKPFFNPPNWLFGPVWTLLYTLIGISLYLIWTQKSTLSKKTAYIVFVIQMVLNALWSVVFFGLHQVWPGFIIIILLLASILAMIVLFRRFSHTASYILVPYAAWVTFAACLNLAIAILNS